MGIQVIITGDNFASVAGDMQDFIDGGHLDISGADFETHEDPTIPAPQKQRRARKPKAAAPANGPVQEAKAASLPASPAITVPVAAAPQTAAGVVAASGVSVQGASGNTTDSTPAPAAVTTLGPDAVAPGGVVFLAVRAYNDKHGMEKARELLLSFGCGMVRQIKPEQYQAVIDKCAA